MSIIWNDRGRLLDRIMSDPELILDVLSEILEQGQADTLTATVCVLTPQEKEALMAQAKRAASLLKGEVPGAETFVQSITAKQEAIRQEAIMAEIMPAPAEVDLSMPEQK